MLNRIGPLKDDERYFSVRMLRCSTCSCDGVWHIMASHLNEVSENGFFSSSNTLWCQQKRLRSFNSAYTTCFLQLLDMIIYETRWLIDVFETRTDPKMENFNELETCEWKKKLIEKMVMEEIVKNSYRKLASKLDDREWIAHQNCLILCSLLAPSFWPFCIQCWHAVSAS